MPTPLAPNEHPAATWLSAIVTAAVTAYAFGTLLSCVLVVLETLQATPRIDVMWLLIGGQVVILVVTTWFLRRINGIWRRVGIGLQRAGWLLIATFPVLLLGTLIIARFDDSPDSGAATAGFFMLVIFGLYYVLQGAVLLGLGAFLKRR